MRNLEALSQFIVPLVFLAIWALTSILNRDGQPLPRRPGAAPGPRPGGGYAPPEARAGRRDALAAARAEEAAASRAASGGAADPRGMEPPASARIGTARPPGRTTDADVYVIDDEMVFIDPVTRRQIGSATIPAPPRPGGRPPQRKPPRNRRAEQGGAKPRRGEAETQRALSEQVGLSMAQNRGEAMTNLASLASSFTSLGGTSLRTASVAATVTSYDAPPALSAADVRPMMAEPARLREMAVLVELLQPPVSRRPGRRI